MTKLLPVPRLERQITLLKSKKDSAYFHREYDRLPQFDLEIDKAQDRLSRIVSECNHEYKKLGKVGPYIEYFCSICGHTH